MTPLEKFKHGVRRIIRIVTSYKTKDFAAIMEELRRKVSMDKKSKELRRRSKTTQQMTAAERTEKVLIMIVDKMDNLDTLMK